MDAIEHMKFVPSIPPGVIKDDAAFVSRVIDTAIAGGAKSLVFVLTLGATDVAMDVLKVMESEVETNPTTLGGSPVEVVDVLPKPGADDDDAIVLVIIDLKQPHARYMQLQATAGDGSTGTYASAVALFTNAGNPEVDMGADIVVRA